VLVVRESTLELESRDLVDHVIHQEGIFVVCFSLNVLMVHTLKFTIIANGNNLTSVGFMPGETIYFGSMEFTADLFGNLSLSPKGNDSGVVFIGIVHSGSPSLHTILEESSDKGDTTSCRGGELWLPQPSRVQRGDPDCPHRHHTAIGEHSGTSDHPDGPAANRHTTTRH
jgi:hypothetical protein